jgi:23S rRNA (adenine-N6)-dimethyltransferase
VLEAGPPGRSWGWHRLADEWAARIVADAGVRPGELVLDIGAGEGALTAHLIQAGARVIAIELHPARVARLRDRFAGLPATQAAGRTGPNAGLPMTQAAGRTGPNAGLTIVHADAATLHLPRRPFRVVASPPYGISARLLSLLLAPGSRLMAADLVLQRAVVRKYARGDAPGSRRWARTFTAAAGPALPRRAFRPAPHVDSAVLVIRRR